MLMHQSRLAPSRVVGVALAIAAASLFADVASARDDGQVSTVVKYGDLDLSQSTDTQRLYVRLKDASEQVCGSERTRDLRMQRLLKACYTGALNRAVERVNEPKLTALHAAAEPRIRVAGRG
jgi:UrcA family protein